MKMRRLFSLMVVLAMVFALGACSPDDAPSSPSGQGGKRTITDSDGSKIEVPEESFRIAPSAPAYTTGIIMAGAEEKLVAVCENIGNNEWLMDKYPRLKELPVVFAGNETNIEALMKTEPDLVFYAPRYGEDGKTRLEELGITVIQTVDSKDITQMEQMRQRQKFYGDAIGGRSREMGEAFSDYFRDALEKITSVTGQIPEKERPCVLAVRALDPLTVIGTEGIGQEWIEIGGGVNAAAGATGEVGISGSIEVTDESVLKWDPEIIICDQPGFVETIMKDKVWGNVSAVKNGKVYVMPSGAMAWGYYGPEEALMIQWSAKIIHPEKFGDLDMNQTAKAFYKTFFGLDLSDEDVEALFTRKTEK